ncbi:MAG: hypothetical protein IKW71_02020 [Elusimicrobiaceae bacterium]|nr:hypothetical protein [Elusimicrobiaceae bacterium]
MEITFVKCESILKTLPIGFYAGRRIETTLDKKEDTSFYSPMEDKIVVSYPIIAHRFEAMPETSTCTDEEAVRSMLYHEVSHAILTPAKAIKCSTMMNIFEDERIETVLRDFYHGVDFQKQLYDIHGGNAPKATDTESAFFNAVRFGLGTPKVQAKIERVLNKYASLNRASVRYSSGLCGSDYEYEVKEIWDMVKKDFPKNPESYQPQDGEGSPVPQNSARPGKGDGEGDEEGNETTTDSESESNKETTSPKKCLTVAFVDIDEAFNAPPRTVAVKEQIRQKILSKEEEVAAAKDLIARLHEENKRLAGLLRQLKPFYERIVVEPHKMFPRPAENADELELGNVLNRLTFAGTDVFYATPLNTPAQLEDLKARIAANKQTIEQREFFIDNYIAQTREEILKLEEQEVKEILTDIYLEIKSFAKKRNIGAVVRKDEVLYGEKPVNVTKDFINRLKKAKKYRKRGK